MPLRLIILCLSLTFLMSCSKSYSWHQKLTVTVQTPTGEISAHSVTEVTKIRTTGKFVFPEARGVTSNLRGEAVVLEVAPGKYLFVLLSGVDQLAFSAFPQFPYERSSEFGRWARSIQRHRGSGVVPPEDYPMMVTFEDIEDPASVRRVDPQNLAASFGQSVALGRLTLEITDESISVREVMGLLPWLGEHPEPGLISATGRTENIPFARRVKHGDFYRK